MTPIGSGSFATNEYTYDSNNYTSFSYDDNGNRTSMKDYKDGQVIDTSYAYDNLDRVKQYVQEGSAVDYAYDGSGNRIKVSYVEGNNTKNIEYNYDAQNRLQNISLNGKVVKDYNYTPSGKIDYANSYRTFDTGGADYIRTKYSKLLQWRWSKDKTGRRWINN